MAEMLWLPSRMLQQCPVSEEIDTPLHAYAVCPTILTPEEQAETEIALRPKYLKVVDQSDIQQIVRFREQVEDEIEVRVAIWRLWLIDAWMPYCLSGIGTEGPDKENGENM